MLDKNRDYFELLIELGIKLRIWYKDKNQCENLLDNQDIKFWVN